MINYKNNNINNQRLISFVKVSGAAWLAQSGKRWSAECEVRLN